jgi:hypothetical protein
MPNLILDFDTTYVVVVKTRSKNIVFYGPYADFDNAIVQARQIMEEFAWAHSQDRMFDEALSYEVRHMNTPKEK